MTQLRRLAVPAYVLAAALVLSACLDLVQAAGPPEIGQITWRVLVFGLWARMLVPPLLALLLVFAAALLLEQPRVLKALSALNALLALILVVGLIFYGLDVLQLRGQLGEDALGVYDTGIFVSFAKYGLGFVMLVWLAIAEWQAAGAFQRGDAAAEAAIAGAGLVFQRGEEDA